MTINEVVIDNTPDYEKFDTFYLKLRATDLNQQINDDTVEGECSLSAFSILTLFQFLSKT